ncbi:DNA replication and repair protein RecN [Thiogranum longum]|uniref:DNA repair protein RecN n=1 Tax=Thiogranum longum TaxID=1537524 RepID=A0A4R1HER9_9GAMM|nr:DNA repair protein RecN [Thiogranum longum]TCK18690.1 DNA replication and repair protein RecN [Thiogranum longum]
MLVSLHIRDFAIIDELEIELHRGMTALTGETGAGKSILLGALGLLLGDRADAGAVRHGSERADLSASFDISTLDRVRNWLQEQSLDLDDECQLRRVIACEGRSRAYINGTSVPLQLLRELGEHLVDIHGQHEHQSLMKRDLQRQLLDRHGKHGATLDKLATLHNDWERVQQDIEAIIGTGNDRDSRLEFLRFQLQELDDLAPQASEVETLHGELARLSNAGQLLETCAGHTESLYDDDRSAHSRLGQAINDLAPLTAIDPSLKEASELFNSALIQLEEGVDLLRDYRDRVELDPQRLQEVEQRIDALHKVAGKHRIEAEALPGFHRQLAEELQQLEQADQRLDALEQQRSTLQDDYRKTAQKLHKQRVKTARQLSGQVSEAMQALGMSGGQLDIGVTETPSDSLSPLGTDQIEFRVSANPGQPPAPLAKVASGGELSRISLAIQVIASEASDIPSLIFDEVDSGVGGAVADTVGQQLRTLGEHRQVLCVTHLPQVASQAHQHLQVTKLTGDQSTRTHIRALDEEERIDEIARMLGGQKITRATLDHARDMLGQLTAVT